MYIYIYGVYKGLRELYNEYIRPMSLNSKPSLDHKPKKSEGRNAINTKAKPSSHPSLEASIKISGVGFKGQGLGCRVWEV